MDKDEQFAELMNKSSLGTPQARRITQRVTPEHAETVRRIAHLRNEIVHGHPRNQMSAARELVDLLRALGFTWREEVPDQLIPLALMQVAELLEDNRELLRANRDLRARITKLERQMARRAQSSGERSASHAERSGRRGSSGTADSQASSARRRSPEPEPVPASAIAGDRPLNEVKFLTVQETAEALRVSKMTVYRLVRDGVLPAIRDGRSFRVPEQAVHDYLQETHTDLNRSR